jgi:hypothetical protein
MAFAQLRGGEAVGVDLHNRDVGEGIGPDHLGVNDR